MILPDTSCWILFFRKGSSLDLTRYAPPEEIWTTPPVMQEVLQGIREDGAYREVRELLRSLHIAEEMLPLELYEQAAHIYRVCRKRGATVRSSVDCLVAAVALRHGLTVLHRDRDYQAIASVTGLSSLQV